LGIIFSQLAAARGHDLSLPSTQAQLRSALAHKLFDEINEEIDPEEFRRKRLEKMRVELHGRLRAEQDSMRVAELRGRLGAAESALAGIKKAGHGVGDVGLEVKKSHFNLRSFEDFSHLLVSALAETLGPHPSYPDYWVERTLSSFLWKRLRSKLEVIDFFSGMPELLVDEALIKDPAKKKAFVDANLRDSPEIDISEMGQPELNHLATQVLRDSESLNFYFKDDLQRKSIYPQLISGDQTRHSSLGGGYYPDCGESALRNFFNLLAYHRGVRKFDAGIFQRANGTHGSRIHPELIHFYEVHFDPSSVGDPRVREDWSERVVSAHAGVRYLKPAAAPQCEVAAGINNFLNAMDRLLAGEVRGISNVEKLNWISGLFSRPGWVLDWKVAAHLEKTVVNELDTGLEITWTINGKSEFTWSFGAMHFEMKKISEPSADRQTKRFYQTLVKRIFEARPASSEDALNWLVSQGAWDAILPQLSAEDSKTQMQKRGLFYALSTASLDSKILAMKGVVQSGLPKSFEKMEKISHQLPAEDFESQARALGPWLSLFPTADSLGGHENQFFSYFSGSNAKKAALLLSLAASGKLDYFESLKRYSARAGVEFHWKRDLLQTNPDGTTVAHEAVRFGKWDVFKWVCIEAPELLLKKDHWNKTPVHALVRTGTVDQLQWIAELNSHALVSEDEFKATPIHKMVEFKRPDLLIWVAHFKPEWLELKNSFGDSPLGLLEKAGNREALAQLQSILTSSSSKL
jgi:hypothetical protein